MAKLYGKDWTRNNFSMTDDLSQIAGVRFASLPTARARRPHR
jgi:hypothetical protein